MAEYRLFGEKYDSDKNEYYPIKLVILTGSNDAVMSIYEDK